MVLDVAEMWRTCVRRGGRLQDVEQRVKDLQDVFERVKKRKRSETNRHRNGDKVWKSLKFFSRKGVRAII